MAASTKRYGSILNISVRIWSGPGDFLGFSFPLIAMRRECLKLSGTSYRITSTRGVDSLHGCRFFINNVYSSGSTCVGATSFVPSISSARFSSLLPLAGFPLASSSAILSFSLRLFRRNSLFISLFRDVALSRSSLFADRSSRVRCLAFRSSLLNHPGRNRAGLLGQIAAHGVTMTVASLREFIYRETAVDAYLIASMIGGRSFLYWVCALTLHLSFSTRQIGM